MLSTPAFYIWKENFMTRHTLNPELGSMKTRLDVVALLCLRNIYNVKLKVNKRYSFSTKAFHAKKAVKH